MKSSSKSWKTWIQQYSWQIVQMGALFLSNLMVARAFGSEKQGEWALYANVLNLFVLLTTFGIPPSLVYFLSSEKIKPQLLRFGTVILWVLIMVLALPALLFMGDIFPAFLPPWFTQNHLWFVLLVFHLLVLATHQIVCAVYQAEKEFVGTSKIIAIGTVLQALLVYVCWQFVELHFLSLWCCLVVSPLIQTVYITQKLKLKKLGYGVFQTTSFVAFTPLIIYGSWVFVTNLFQFLNYRMDIWILNGYHVELQHIGAYSIAAMVAQLIWVFPLGLQTISFQQISAQINPRDSIRTTSTYLRAILLYLPLAWLIGFYLAPYIIPWLFGSEYQHTVSYFQLLLFGVVPFCLTMPISAYFSGREKVYINCWSAVVGLIIGLIVNVLLVPKQGATGAAIASVCSYLGTTLFLFVAFIIDYRKVMYPNQ